VQKAKIKNLGDVLFIPLFIFNHRLNRFTLIYFFGKKKKKREKVKNK